MPVESPPRTVQEYVVQATRPSAPDPQPVLDAPSHDLREGSEEVDAAAVALRQLESIVQMPEPPPPKALTRQNSAHVVEKFRERGDVSREEITEALPQQDAVDAIVEAEVGSNGHSN